MLKENFEHKMILAVLTGAAVSLPATANAVLQVGSGPITVSLADPIGQTVWDVDGDGNADFHIVNEDSGSVEFLAITSAGLNGRGFAGPATDQAAITRVSFGGQIGRPLATGTWGLWGAGSRIVGNHTAVTATATRAFPGCWKPRSKSSSPSVSILAGVCNTAGPLCSSIWTAAGHH